MSKKRILRYSATFLGTIEICGDEKLTENQIQNLIAEDFYQWGNEIGYANDVEYEIEEC